MKNKIFLMVIIILNIIIYATLFIWNNKVSIVNLPPINTESFCLKTENQEKILNCTRLYNLKFFEKNKEFKFEEKENDYLENDYNLFLINYEKSLNNCINNCENHEVNYFKAQINCLQFANVCNLYENKNINMINIIDSCEKKCKNYYFENASYFLKNNITNNCEAINGKALFINTELQKYFNQKKENICKNIKKNKEVKKIKLRNIGEDPDFSIEYPYNNGFYKFNGATSIN